MKKETKAKVEKIKTCCKDPKIFLIFAGMVLIAGVVIVALVRERIVNPNLNQVTVNGEGRVSCQPDVANITLGTQIDKAETSEEALRLLNEKMNNAIGAVKAVGINESDIKTMAYSLYPQYEYKDGESNVSGYGASQQLKIKVKNLNQNSSLANQVISAASGAGINQVSSINFEISNLNDLKQTARIKAIEDARSKAGALARAAGIKRLGKVLSWYENVVQSPDMQFDGYGGNGSPVAETAVANSNPQSASQVAPQVIPQVPSGDQEIIINMGVNYEVK